MNESDKRTLRTLQSRIQDHVRNYQAAHVLTNKQLAYECGLSEAVIRDAREGRINPTMSTLILLAKGIGIAPSEMISEASRFVDTTGESYA